MTSRDFCYWLQGYFELRNGLRNGQASGWSTEQAALVQRHLAMVFIHEIDPSFPKSQQEALGVAHQPKPYDPHTDSATGTSVGGVAEGGLVFRC